MTESPAGRPSNAEIEALDRSRRHMLFALVVTTCLWIVPQILREALVNWLPRALNNALILAGVAGALAYVALMLRFHRYQRRIQTDPDLRERLDDERVLELRKTAVYRGWITLVVAIGLGVGVAPFTDLPDQAVLLTLLLVAVTTPLLFFLALDRS